MGLSDVAISLPDVVLSLTDFIISWSDVIIGWFDIVGMLARTLIASIVFGYRVLKSYEFEGDGR